MAQLRVVQLAGGLVLLASCSGRTVSPPGVDPFAMLQASAEAAAAGGAPGASGAAGTAGLPIGVLGVGGFPTSSPLGDDAITKVVPSDGCGKPFDGTSGQLGTIQTMGTKAPNCADHLNGVAKCGPWSTPRYYFLYVPPNYDPNKPYSLVFQGPGCGGNGTDIYALNNNVDGTVIRVGLTPGPNSLGHGTNENQGCFDDKEGDDSIDWVFYEALYDGLNAQLCFDRNRVFASGHSSGAWFANELGCKYAGDPLRPVRGVIVDSGGLPTDPKYVPTCTSAPMAGMWVHEVADTTTPFSNDKVAIARAMALDACVPGTDYDTASLHNFPIGGGQADDVCKYLADCNPLYPLVVCALTTFGRGSHDPVANNGFSIFIKSFGTGQLLTQ